MKKLLLLFIPLVFIFGCEKDNPNATASNSQSNINDDEGNQNSDECNVQGFWNLASLYQPPSYSGYEYPYCELFCGFEEIAYYECESSNGYIDDYYEQCVDFVLSANGDITIVVWNMLSLDSWYIDHEQHGTWAIPKDGNSCELLIIDNPTGFDGVFEMTAINSSSLLLENIDDGVIYLLVR